MRPSIVAFWMVIAYSFAPGSSESRATNITPQSVELEIRTLGAKAVVDKLNSGRRPRNWDLVLDRIGSGAAEGLAVAKELVPGTDAGTSTGLRVTLAKALPKNPGDVLRLIDEKEI